MASEGSEKKENLNTGLQKADVSDNKCGEALRAALEKEEILRTIINNSQVVLFLWKNEDKWPVEFVSENVTNFGYTVEDLTSGRVMYWDIIYPDDLDDVQEKFEEEVKSGALGFILEYRILTKAGAVRWINQRTFIQRDADGKITHFEGVVLDITKRKESGEKLEKVLRMQRMLTTAINNSPAVVFLWKNERYWPVVFVSENIIQFGYTVDDFLSERILYGEIMHPDDLKRVEEELERSIQKGEVNFNSEYRIFTKTGDVRWVNERTFIQRDGKVTCFQGIIIDITERKEAQVMLEIQKELGTSLSTTWNLQTMLNTVLDACLRIEYLDAGGIYLKDELLDQINLVAHRGLSSEFVMSISTYEIDSPEARQVWTEKPIYSLDFFSDKMADLIRKEKITAVAVIPMIHRGEITGSLNFASRTTDRISQNVRDFLESVAQQVVNYIAPIRIVADLA